MKRSSSFTQTPWKTMDATEFVEEEIEGPFVIPTDPSDDGSCARFRTYERKPSELKYPREESLEDQDQGQRDGAGDGILNVVDLGVDLISNIGVNLISNIGVDPILNIGVDLISNVADTEGIAPAAVPTVGSLAAENKSEDLPILAVEAADEAESLWSLWSRAAWKMKVEIVALVAWLVWMVILIREDDIRIWPLHHF